MLTLGGLLCPLLDFLPAARLEGVSRIKTGKRKCPCASVLLAARRGRDCTAHRRELSQQPLKCFGSKLVYNHFQIRPYQLQQVVHAELV